MKTVSEIAKEMGVSPQAVYKKINGSMGAELKKHLHKDKRGRTVIDSTGARLLMGKGSAKDPSSTKQKKPVDNSMSTLLMEQLREKDKQISELLDQNTSLIQKLENMQVLLKNEQQQKTLLLESPTEKKGLFSFLKKKV